MKIGILQTGHSPEELLDEFGDYDRMFADMLDGHAFQFVTYDVEHGQLPASAAEADGWVITGSKHGAYEDHPWIRPLEELIQEISQMRIPLIGACFGHQIIAQALGGRVEKFAGGWSVGRIEYQFEGRTVALNAWHQDQVVERPQGARLLGSSDFCENAMLAYGDHILTVQAHPEYGPEFIRGLIRTRGPGVVPADLLTQADLSLDAGPFDNAEFGARLSRVLTGGGTQ